MDFIEEMRARGLIAQIIHEPEFKEHLSSGPRTAYVGMDPTAESLHVGHLLPIMVLARWQRAGHRAIALMGGGTAMIGDPTGKTEMRRVLTEAEIDKNIQGFKKQLHGLLDLSSPKKGIILNNADWLTPLRYISFLRDIGVHFSVNKMLTAECFKARLETGLSFIEFNYMLLQSYDFYHLYKAEKCTVQLGGDDQWSNILAGVDLVRRMGGPKTFCLTNPLLTTPDGKKMGKTEKGAVWLDPNLTQPYEYFQYWRNVEDAMVLPCLRYFTFLTTSEMEDLAKEATKDINAVKVVLAYETTKILHGEEEADKAKASAQRLFAKGGGEDAGDGNEPVVHVDGDLLKTGNVVDVLVAAGVFASKSEARRLIEQGGLSCNGNRVPNANWLPGKEVADWSKGALFRKGKKHYYRLRIRA